MAMTLGGTAIHANIENHGVGYKFIPPEILHDDGEGLAVLAPYASIVWSFDIMEPADYDWLTITLLGNAQSVIYSSGISLYNRNRVLTSYAYCVARAPTDDGISAGWYRNIVWKIEYIQ